MKNKEKTSQLTIGALILVIFVVLVAVYYFKVKTPITPRTTTTIRTNSLTDCSDIEGACFSLDDCAEGETLQQCCSKNWGFLNRTGICESGFNECNANQCCCHSI